MGDEPVHDVVSFRDPQEGRAIRLRARAVGLLVEVVPLQPPRT